MPTEFQSHHNSSTSQHHGFVTSYQRATERGGGSKNDNNLQKHLMIQVPSQKLLQPNPTEFTKNVNPTKSELGHFGNGGKYDGTQSG